MRDRTGIKNLFYGDKNMKFMYIEVEGKLFELQIIKVVMLDDWKDGKQLAQLHINKSKTVMLADASILN